MSEALAFNWQCDVNCVVKYMERAKTFFFPLEIWKTALTFYTYCMFGEGARDCYSEWVEVRGQLAGSVLSGYYAGSGVVTVFSHGYRHWDMLLAKIWFSELGSEAGSDYSNTLIEDAKQSQEWRSLCSEHLRQWQEAHWRFKTTPVYISEF